ncbi:unnamed protein product [Amoebophrya sp. A120]|nr:unnamed protein product [Amoebophrya sp. A120]|eukprot:GSA120T00014213001.1
MDFDRELRELVQEGDSLLAQLKTSATSFVPGERGIGVRSTASSSSSSRGRAGPHSYPHRAQQAGSASHVDSVQNTLHTLAENGDGLQTDLDQQEEKLSKIQNLLEDLEQGTASIAGIARERSRSANSPLRRGGGYSNSYSSSSRIPIHERLYREETSSSSRQRLEPVSSSTYSGGPQAAAASGFSFADQHPRPSSSKQTAFLFSRDPPGGAGAAANNSSAGLPPKQGNNAPGSGRGAASGGTTNKPPGGTSTTGGGAALSSGASAPRGPPPASALPIPRKKSFSPSSRSNSSFTKQGKTRAGSFSANDGTYYGTGGGSTSIAADYKQLRKQVEKLRTQVFSLDTENKKLKEQNTTLQQQNQEVQLNYKLIDKNYKESTQKAQSISMIRHFYETETEELSQLIDQLVNEQMELKQALRKACQSIQNQYEELLLNMYQGVRVGSDFRDNCLRIGRKREDYYVKHSFFRQWYLICVAGL